MRRFRFHLGTLVILILLLEVGFAALRESNEIWDSSIFSITLGVLLSSILLAIHRAEKRRAFLAGVRSVRVSLPGALSDSVNRTQADHNQGVGFSRFQSAGANFRNLPNPDLEEPL